MAPSKSPLMRLGHIRDEIASLLPLRVTERAILIIAEAAKALPGELTARYPQVEWHAIRGMGNILRHEYERVETEVLWRVVTRSLPELAPIIERMIGELDV